MTHTTAIQHAIRALSNAGLILGRVEPTVNITTGFLDETRKLVTEARKGLSELGGEPDDWATTRAWSGLLDDLTVEATLFYDGEFERDRDSNVMFQPNLLGVRINNTEAVLNTMRDMITDLADGE